MAVQSAIASPLNRSGFTTSVFPSKYLPRLQNARTQVRCKADDKDDLLSQIKEFKPPTLPKGDKDEPAVTRLTPPPSKNVSPKFIDVLAFTGPGPERINGRLAMIGFVSAMAVELTRRQDLFTQISNGGYMWFVWTSILFTVASLIPFSKGVGPGATSDRFWNPDAEVWNGRAAMVGLVALAVTEFLKGVITGYDWRLGLYP